MVIGDMPVVVQDTSSSFEKPTESQSPGDERKSCNFEDDYFPDSAEHSPLHMDQGPDDDESVFMDSAAMTGPAAVSIDSAQHLLQSISSDDDGSRSPSPIRGSPGAFPASFPSPGVVRSPDTNDVPQVPVSSASVTIDDISSCEDFKVISLIGNLVSHDRHPFVKYAIRRFSHDLMLSLKNNSSFLSDIEIWCRDAFEDQDAVFLEDLLLLIELLPVDDITSVASLSQFLSNSKMFFESSFQLQAKRILKKWDSLRPKKFDSSTGAKDTGHVDSENPAEVNTSAADRPSRLPPNPKSNFRTRRNASHYGQPNHTTRRSSPAYSSYHSEFRRDEVSEQPTATPRKQPSPRRNSSPRNAIRTKMVDEVGAERRSGTSGHFSRDAPYRAQGGRMNDTNNPNSYHSRSGHDSQINRPSTHQFQSQRERSSSSFQQSYPDRRVHDPSHRLESAPDSRSRNNDIFPSESPASSNRGPHSHRDPSSGHSFKRNDVYSEKDYYSDSEHRISNFTTRSASAPLKSFEGRIKTEYNKPRESAPSSYRSGAQESRSSKYPYDDGASRSQRQFHSSSTHNRSVTPPPAVRSRSPHSYRVDERLHHEDDRLENGSRDFRRYSTDTNPKPSFSQGSHYASSRGIKPPPRDNYRDYRREEDKDSRQSLTRDYRQDLTRDFRQEESQSSRHNDVSRDFHQPSSKRKPDFKWNHDGPSKSMRLSDEERRDLVQKGACLYCRKPGHTIENCRTRPARSSLPH